MSKFLAPYLKDLVPYIPGEQPQDKKYIKLNTNENPYPPSPMVQKALLGETVDNLRLYGDPTCAKLIATIAEKNAVKPEQVIVGNGSDEVLFFALRAFCDEEHGLAVADITYGFYSVWCDILHVPMEVIPLESDFSILPKNYFNKGKTIIIANPNAPTGLAISLGEVEKILKANKENIVIIDEAYVDFGSKSATTLIAKYENLLVVQTFSKSRSFAGARLGFAIGNAELIKDLNAVKFSLNPYNVNSLTMAAGIASMEDVEYFEKTRDAIIAERENTSEVLRGLGFEVLPSKTNFIFAKHPKISGEELFLKLRENGVLIRYFSAKRTAEFIRITIGTPEDMRKVCEIIKTILSNYNK